MTARAFNTVRAGFRVSGGATLGFKTRCGNHTARRFRKLFKSTPALDVASLRQDQGGICAIGEVGSVTAHGADHERGPVHEAEYGFHGKENAV